MSRGHPWYEKRTKSPVRSIQILCHNRTEASWPHNNIKHFKPYQKSCPCFLCRQCEERITQNILHFTSYGYWRTLAKPHNIIMVHEHQKLSVRNKRFSKNVNSIYSRYENRANNIHHEHIIFLLGVWQRCQKRIIASKHFLSYKKAHCTLPMRTAQTTNNIKPKIYFIPPLTAMRIFSPRYTSKNVSRFYFFNILKEICHISCGYQIFFLSDYTAFSYF